MTPHEILIAAKALISDEEHWWRGCGVTAEACERGCYCPYTAIYTVSEGFTVDRNDALSALDRVIGTCAIGDWNDAPERTLAEVHAAFDRAIKETKPDTAELRMEVGAG